MQDVQTPKRNTYAAARGSESPIAAQSSLEKLAFNKAVEYKRKLNHITNHVKAR